MFNHSAQLIAHCTDVYLSCQIFKIFLYKKKRTKLLVDVCLIANCVLERLTGVAAFQKSFWEMFVSDECG